MRNPFDGLIHQADGSRMEAETDAVVGGVNNYHQRSSKHKNIEGLSKYHPTKIRSWHLESIGENESVTEAMNRQEELDKAEKKMTKKAKHQHHNLNTVVEEPQHAKKEEHQHTKNSHA